MYIIPAPGHHAGYPVINKGEMPQQPLKPENMRISRFDHALPIMASGF
jgi:hypothetical protein